MWNAGAIRVVFGAVLLLHGISAAKAQTAGDLYEQAVDARQAENFEEAISLLTRALALEPDNADALIQLGYSRLALDDRTGAKDAFDRALVIVPDYQDARYGLALIAFRDGDLNRADALLTTILAEQPDYEDGTALAASVARARVAASVPVKTPEARPGKAVPIVRASRKKSALAITVEQARNMRRAGDLAGAEAAYRHALAQSPDDADLLVALGGIASARQMDEEAEALFERALLLAPGYTDARAGLIRIALRRGELKRVRTMLGELDAATLANAEIATLSGRVALEERRYRFAKEEFTRALAADPSNVEVLSGLGDAQTALGDDAAARETFERAIEIDPDSAGIAARLARPPALKWRIDFGSEYSMLTGGRPAWTDSSATLSYRMRPDTTVALSGRTVTRGTPSDVQLGFRLDHRFSERFAAYGQIAVTPDADILPDASLGAGFGYRIADDMQYIGGIFADFSIKHDIYPDNSITTIAPGIGVMLNDRMTVYARWIHSESDSGAFSDGYLLRADLRPVDRVGLFAGYSDAPEISGSSLDETRTWFAGVSLDISEQLTLRASYSNESREAFTRQTAGFAFSYRF